MAYMKVGIFQFNGSDRMIRIYQRVIGKRLLAGQSLFFQTAGSVEADGSNARAVVIQISPSSELSFHYDSEFVPDLEKDDSLAIAWADQVEKIGVLLAGGFDLSEEEPGADSAVSATS